MSITKKFVDVNMYQQGKISHGNPWLCMCESCVNDINADPGVDDLLLIDIPDERTRLILCKKINERLELIDKVVKISDKGKLFILIYRELLGHTWFPESEPEIMKRLYQKLNDFGYETYLPVRRMVEYCDRIIFPDRFKS